MPYAEVTRFGIESTIGDTAVGGDEGNPGSFGRSEGSLGSLKLTLL